MAVIIYTSLIKYLAASVIHSFVKKMLHVYLYVASAVAFGILLGLCKACDKLIDWLFPCLVVNNNNSPFVTPMGFRDKKALFALTMISVVVEDFFRHFARCLNWTGFSWTRVIVCMVYVFSMSHTVLLSREAVWFCRLRWWQYACILVWLALFDVFQPFQGAMCRLH